MKFNNLFKLRSVHRSNCCCVSVRTFYSLLIVESGDCLRSLCMLYCFWVRSRCSARSCMEHAWLRKNFTQPTAALPVRTITLSRLADFIQRRRHEVHCRYCLCLFCSVLHVFDRGSTMTATNRNHQLGEIYRTMSNELNCTFGVSFSRFHCCGQHSHGLWP